MNKIEDVIHDDVSADFHVAPRLVLDFVRTLTLPTSHVHSQYLEGWPSCSLQTESDKRSPKQAAHAAACAASLGLQPERVDARRRGTRAAVQPFRRDIGVRALMAHDGGGGVA